MALHTVLHLIKARALFFYFSDLSILSFLSLVFGLRIVVYVCVCVSKAFHYIMLHKVIPEASEANVSLSLAASSISRFRFASK